MTPPRVIPETEAALYVGCVNIDGTPNVEKFRAKGFSGKMPYRNPVCYDRKALDRDLDLMHGLTKPDVDVATATVRANLERLK